MKLRQGLVPAVAVLASLVLAATAGFAARGEPDLIRVQHALIGFKGSVRGKEIARTKEEAKALAADVLARAQKGEDFDALVKQYTDDKYPGVYLITNDDAPLRSDAFKRSGMVSGFGDVAFALAVGEVGVAKYHAAASPYGWHVIKRLE